MITVQRCQVRVIRRGGWSWGPDPRVLVREALAALPGLLTEQFGDLLTGDGPDLEITGPVVLSVRLGSRPGLAVEPAIGPPPIPVPVPVPVPIPEPVPVPVPVPPSAGEPPPLPDVPAAPIATLFEELAVRDELTSLLALLPDETLRRYVTALRGEPEELSPPVVAALTAEPARRRPSSGQPVTLMSAVPGTHPASPAAASAHDTAGLAPVVTAIQVCPALPFLLAGPLARTGYLDAIGPALAAEAPLFAAALAYKVLGAPERGWRRTPGDHAAAAAFAGLAEAPDLTGFAERAEPALPLLDGVLALSLCRGHDPADPLLLIGLDGGLLLVDTRGVFPIAWAPGVAGLLPHWTACGRPPVLVCDGPLPASALRDLAGAGADVLTDARPLRGDPLSRFPGRGPLWSSGEPGPPVAAAFPGHAERAAELVRSLFVERIAAPRARDSALERSAGLAASLALGLIAWTLWRDRETTDPVLALTRLADLEATVEHRPGAVRVRLPLGRRHTDLWRHGLLTDVPDVVWLGGRSLTFSGG
ncbi:hypothetical protein ACQPZJ_15290 [Actinoplanes sp. CA-054009]